jgi:di/tricarboxylate transporter
VTGPGGYRAKDFLRVGIPLTLAMLLVTLVAINLLFR